MFRIIGDEIEYERRPFARILMPEFSTLRAYATEDIEACDAAAREAEDKKWRDEVDGEHATETEALEARIEALQAEVTKYLGILNSIDDGATCADLIAAAQKERDDWRKIAEDNRAAYYKAIKPKPRKRRVAAT